MFSLLVRSGYIWYGLVWFLGKPLSNWFPTKS